MSGFAADGSKMIAPRAAPRRGVRLSWHDPKFRAIVWQLVVLGGLAAAIFYLAHNTHVNLQHRHIATGFGFLDQTASIPISESLIPYEPGISTYGTALLVGFLNTLKVAVLGCVLATIWGTVLGIGRLSKNWLIAKLAAIYVELIRDIPVLLQLFFWYGLLEALPGPRQSIHVGPDTFLSNRGIKVPLLEWQAAHGWALAAFAIGVVGTVVYNRSARRLQDQTGVRPRVWPVAGILLLGLPVAVWAALGAPFSIDRPVLQGFNFVGGGTITPEYFALLLGLVVYTATYIAEIVRSGIQAVPKGQWEAATAIGLRPGVVLRRIVLPQALRVIIPPLTSQFLNLTKNSSLAVAIGYQDIVSTADTTLNQTGQSIEGIAIIMVAYLSISLSISLFMNWYNARIALVER